MESNTYTYATDKHKPFGQTEGVEESIDTYSGCEPFIRVAPKPDEQRPRLRRIDEPISNDINFTSPIYYLKPGEIQRQNELSNAYAVSETCIAKQLQNVAEIEGRVYYPIYVESDAEVPLDTQIEWLRGFVWQFLNVDPSECDWYFSGGRSVHVHVPKLARHRDREALKSLAKEYEHDLDDGIYQPKSQFRLPGAEHSDTGFSKVPIEPEWSHDRIIREATTSDVSRPESVKGMLTQTFGANVLSDPEAYLWQPASDSDDEGAGVNEWEYHSTGMGWATHRLWKAHYAVPVSPYAHSGNGDRSLLVAKVIDGAFSEKRETNQEGSNRQESQIFVPCEILAFWSCDREYTIENGDYRPVRLSKADYRKFVNEGITDGDTFVMVGGQSRKSRLLIPRTFESNSIGGSKDFSDAIETLEVFDYDAGESKCIESNYDPSSSGDRSDTRVGRLMDSAEANGIELLSHGERLLVMLRLLRVLGIEGTREWFQEQYGDAFDRELTDTHIRSACEKYDDTPDYSRRKVSEI